MPEQKKQENKSLKDQRVKKYLQHEEAFGTCLLGIVIDYFGMEALEWEPDSIRMELKDRFSTDLTQENANKLFAMMTAVLTDQFFLVPTAYSYICQALNGDEVNFDTFNPPDPDDIAWGTTEVMLNSIDIKTGATDAKFSNEVAQFAGFILDSAGMTFTPAGLEFAIYPDGRGGGTTESDELFADDEDLYQSALSTQQALTADTNAYVRGKADALVKHVEWLMLGKSD